ncbi:TonB-dependent receptor [Ancylomarina salipaludis]|uniref:TonB-dependent receptor n=2 Tax=Ancylomarina salipaludis TaxID=2501299 RepID=A0A4Q1JN62_9BACT|nr:TonB-dependent receptor [Ancylomarina salipaludis]
MHSSISTSMKRLIFLFIILLSTYPIFATKTTNTEKFGVINGYIKDMKSNASIEYATVSVFTQDDSKLIDGTITNKDGFFEIKKLRAGNYYIEVSFIGYEKKIVSDIAIRSYKRENKLNDIKLDLSTKALQEIVVNSDKDAIDYQIDKKIVPVSNQLSAEGGTAINVLETVPSVSVDVNGNVSLRGSTDFTVLLDGRPSVRSAQEILSQIPTSQIENIEIITNPSAKYEAEGGAGIINIISKKVSFKGASGFLNLSPGSHENFASTGMFNFKKKKSNFYLGANYNVRAYGGKRENFKTIFSGPQSYLNAFGKLDSKDKSHKISSAYDFEIDSLNLFSITAEIGHSTMDKLDKLTYEKYETQDNILIDNSKEATNDELNYYVATLTYLRKFNKKGHQLNTLIDYSGKTFDKSITNENQSETENNTYLSSIEEDAKGIVISSDYTLPLAGNGKFEAGYQYLSFDFNRDRSFVENTSIKPNFSKPSDYKKTIQSLYTTYSGKLNKISYQVGLRAEHLNREIKYDGNKSDLNRWDLFPSFHSQMSISKVSKISASYSRRINRPSSGQLEGFQIWNDVYNRTIGNPELNPELTNSFELQYNTKIGKHSFSLTSYYRSNEDKIERIKTLSAINPDVIISSYQNVGTDHGLGLEAFTNISISKWWRYLMSVDFSHYKIDGDYTDSADSGSTEKHKFSTSSNNWKIISVSRFKLSKLTQFELNLKYNSKTKWAQGEQDDSFVTTMSLKHSFFKRKLSASFIVTDVFNTADLSKSYYNNDYSLVNNFDRDAPTFKLSLSYKINNYKSVKRVKSTDIGNM